MRKSLATLLAFSSLLISSAAFTAVNSDTDYLPDNVTYDPTIPTPESVLGSPVGEWHVRHDQLVQYMYALAEASPRVTLVETGRTHENRPLVLLAITSEENQQNLETIRQQHLARVDSGELPGEDSPLVIWMGYSVHGNEPSGSNAALVVAYYLTAGQDQMVDDLLNNNVVLFDPSINPDGLSRFAQWANMHRGQNLVADPQHREHMEHWPSGRTNHYWFDLNRDWLLLTHPSSRARIAQYHAWRPHVLTDFHEMGTNATYFFQPGISSRRNPWTPEQNETLTAALGDFHAAALDAAGELYYTQESFDDFYYGKGSTYPDAWGSIGILFEQASSRGHLQDSIHGPLAFSDTIQNQVTTSLSTFKGALANKTALLSYQKAFKDETDALIKDDKTRGYLIGKSKDPARFAAMRDILERHQIAYQGIEEDVTVDEQKFLAGETIFVSVDQPGYRLIKSIFSTRTSFRDNTFYDVSNWNMPLAFNLPYAGLTSSKARKLELVDYVESTSPAMSDEALNSAYALAFEWHDYNAPALLQALLAQGVKVKAAAKDFTAETTQGRLAFGPGTVVIPRGLNGEAQEVVVELAKAHNIPLHAITSGLTSQGIDLGSRNMVSLDPINVLLVGGLGTSQYEVGEIWHYLDTRMGLSPTIIDLAHLGNRDLTKYTHIIMASGRYSSVPKKVSDTISKWVKDGGTLIGQKTATQWFTQQEWLPTEFIDREDIDDAFETEELVYGDRDALQAKKLVRGAVFETALDLTHPLGFGFTREQLPMFKTSNAIMQAPTKPFITPAKYTEAPLMAGYAAPEIEEMIGETAAIVALRVGNGRIIGFADNLNFRGYWYGTSRLLSNAIFFAPMIQERG